MALLTQNAGNSTGEIAPGQVKVLGPEFAAKYTDNAALKLVVQDAETSDAFLAEHMWAAGWRESGVLYQSPRISGGFEGSTTPRPNVPDFMVAEHVNSIVPQLMSGMFYDDPPFVLRPRPGTKQNAVRAKTAVFSALLEEMDFEEEVEQGLFSGTNLGTGIWKWGWESKKKIQKVYKRKRQPVRVPMPLTGESKRVYTQESDECEVVEITKIIERPFFEKCDIDHVLPAPGWNKPDIRKAKYVIHRMYLTFNELNELRDDPEYDLPSEEELKGIFFGGVEHADMPGQVEMTVSQSNQVMLGAEPRYKSDTADPLEQPLEVLERWDDDHVMTVVQGKCLIRNKENPFHEIPFYSCNWWNVEKAGWGMGVGRIVGAQQRVKTGVTNSALSMLSFTMEAPIYRNRAANIPTQNIRLRLGGFIDGDLPPDEAYRVMEMPHVPPEVWAVLQAAKASGEGASGANEILTQGNLPDKGRTSMGRTATGAGGMMAASAARLQGPVGRFVRNVFLPWIKKMDELINDRMPEGQIRQILGEELGQDFEIEMDDYLNADMQYEVLAGTHLAAKKAMAQSLPLMIQILENPALLTQLNDMGWTVDVKEIFDMFMEMSDWKNTRDLIRKMTPEEMQKKQQANPGIQKAQGEMAKENQKHVNKSQEIDQTQTALLARNLIENSADRAAGETLRSSFTAAAKPEALTGEPGGAGFGA
jgi:hypothetical protein